MERKATLSIVLALFSIGVWADSAALNSMLDPLTGQINALVGSVESDVAPQLLQIALSNDIVGEAALSGNFPHGSLTVSSLSVSFGHGLGTVLSNGTYDFSGNTINLQSIIQNNAPSNLYTASQQVFPYPSFSGGIGFGIVNDFEILASGYIIPQSLTDLLVNKVGASYSSVSSLDPQFSTSNLLVKVRKVLFHDTASHPAMSLALGAVYGQTTFGVGDFDLSKLGDVDLGSGTTLNLTGPASFTTQVFGTGLEFAVSKRLPLITPFANAGIWYRHAVASSDVNLLATISDGTNTATKTIQISPSYTDDAIAGRLGAGFELRLWAVILHLSAHLDLENPLIYIKSFSLTDIALNGLSINTGLRINW
jgi:hypothetical protein